jgi:hypothetical protein
MAILYMCVAILYMCVANNVSMNKAHYQNFRIIEIWNYRKFGKTRALEILEV